MRLLEKKVNEKGHIIMTIEKSFLFGLIKVKEEYIATEEFPEGYWNWLKLPNKTLVGTHLSFQLDSWCRCT